MIKLLASLGHHQQSGWRDIYYRQVLHSLGRETQHWGRNFNNPPWPNLYYNCKKYLQSPLKPRGLALLSWHVPYNWGSGNSVHQSFTWFLSLTGNWRKSTFYRSRCRYHFKINSWWPIVTSSTHGPDASYCDVTMAHCSHGYLWTHDVEVGAS